MAESDTEQFFTEEEKTEVLKAIEDKEGEKKLTFMVAGKTGAGKSTLINSFLGLRDPTQNSDVEDAERGAVEGDTGLPTTSEVESFSNKKNGIIIEVWDTPGFEDRGENPSERIFAQMITRIRENLDLMVFCMKFETGGRVEESHRRIMTDITRIFKPSIWENAVIVMTMVNRMDTIRTEDAYRDGHKKKLENIENELKRILKEIGVPEDVADSVPFVTAGKEREVLPHEDVEWSAKLFGHCLCKISKRKIPVLLRARYQITESSKMGRILAAIGIGTTAGAAGGAGAGAGLGAAIGAFFGSIIPGLGTLAGAVSGGYIGGVAGIAVGPLAGASLGYIIARIDQSEEKKVESAVKKDLESKQK